MPEYVSGLRETIRGLETLGVELDDLKDVFGGIAREAAEIIADAAPSKSGRLRASVRGNRAKNKATVQAGSARVRYAAPVNYGWPRRHIRAHEFMQAADERLGPQLVDRLEQGITDAIRKAGLE